MTTPDPEWPTFGRPPRGEPGSWQLEGELRQLSRAELIRAVHESRRPPHLLARVFDLARNAHESDPSLDTAELVEAIAAYEEAEFISCTVAAQSEELRTAPLVPSDRDLREVSEAWGTPAPVPALPAARARKEGPDEWEAAARVAPSRASSGPIPAARSESVTIGGRTFRRPPR